MEASSPTSSASASHSPVDQYKADCQRLGVHCNSDILRSFPTEPVTLNSVKHLDFSRNFFGRNGIRPILFSLLTQCIHLESLNISQNYLSNENIEELYEMLTGKKAHLVSSPSKEAMAPLTSALCPNLKYLDVSNNPLSNPAGKLLSRLVDERPQLRCIVAHGTLMNAGLVRVIEGKCARRSPRFEGLRALNLATEEVRVMKGGSSSGSADQQSPTPPMSTRRADGTEHEAESAGGTLHTASTKLQRVSGSSGKEAAASQGFDEWSAMETIWNLAAVAAPPEDGWTGLAAVMALVRHDVTIASMY